ncbi:MAG: hypothetical protein Fur0043_26350 [Anaerolineales bacterium]
MRTIRRLYFYLVAFISLEVVTWGLIGLLRSIVSSILVDMAGALARALALLLVGAPIFLFHWQWGQRAAARDVEERTASLRAVFYYAALLATLIPVAQNLLALVNRALLMLAHAAPARALVGASQSWQDNLIAIAVNGLLAAWLWNALGAAWKSLPESDNFRDARRLYRYLWLLYGLGMTVFGAQQALRFLFDLPQANYLILGAGQRSFFNGLALLLVGTPLWVYTWRICQDAWHDSAERTSNLRLGAFYLLTLGGAVSALAAGGALLDVLLRYALGESMTVYELTRKIGGPLSVGAPLAVVWAYYGGWLMRQIRFDEEASRRAGKRRFYYYVLATLGLGASFLGLAFLLSFIVDLLVSYEVWGGALRPRLAAALATLAAGLPVWLATWRPMQAEALEDSLAGEEARRAPLRRAYLYLALFAGVIGGMVSAVWLAYTLLEALFTRQASANFLSNVLNAAQLLALFAMLLLYHLRCLQRDGAQTAQTLEARQRAFPLAVLDGGDATFAEKVQTAMQRHAPALPFELQTSESFPQERDFKAIILPASLALNPPAGLRRWLEAFEGEKIVVATEAVAGWVLNALTPEQAAQAARQLAEGQRVRLARPSSAWNTVQMVAVVVLGLQLLLVLFSLGMSLLGG